MPDQGGEQLQIVEICGHGFLRSGLKLNLDLTTEFGPQLKLGISTIDRHFDPAMTANDRHGLTNLSVTIGAMAWDLQGVKGQAPGMLINGMARNVGH